jgi:hypothetical protein
VAYLPATDTVYAANAGDGSVQLFRGPDYAPAGQIDLGDDADNIRLDIPANRIVVGYGSGGLAVIDPASSRKVADIPLSVTGRFQLDRQRPDLGQSSQNASHRLSPPDWTTDAAQPMQTAGGNFDGA